VKDRLLSQLASCGIRQLLKLRLICKETKSWVDSSPARQARILFSKSHVKMDFNVETVERFLESPPPFHIPGLSLKLTNLRDIHELRFHELTAEEQLIFPDVAPLTLNPAVGAVPEDSIEMWNNFCDYWDSRLESLRIRKTSRDLGPKTNNEVAHVIRKLLDSPHLDKLSFSDDRFKWKYLPPFPTSFHTFSDMSDISFASVFDGSFHRPLYPTLEQNPNLKRLCMEFYHPEEFEFIHKIAEKNKRNSGFQLALRNTNDFYEEEDDLMALFSTLVKTLVKCDFQTCLTILLGDINGFLQVLRDQLGAGDYCRFLNFFENLTLEKFVDSPLAERTLENFENLKILDMELNDVETPLRFPPNLVELTYGMGFPSIGNLPLSLKELTLDYLSCGFEEFGESLTALGSQCVNLERLELIWFCEENNKQTETPKETKNGNGDFATTIKFRG